MWTATKKNSLMNFFFSFFHVLLIFVWMFGLSSSDCTWLVMLRDVSHNPVILTLYGWLLTSLKYCLCKVYVLSHIYHLHHWNKWKWLLWRSDLRFDASSSWLLLSCIYSDWPLDGNEAQLNLNIVLVINTPLVLFWNLCHLLPQIIYSFMVYNLLSHQYIHI